MPIMLFRDRKEYNRWLLVFDYNGFSLYSYKAVGGGEVDLPDPRGKERLVFPLRGRVRIGDVWVGAMDMAYVPRDAEARLWVDGGTVLFAASAPAERAHPMYVKRYADARRFSIGMETYRRTVVVSIGEEDPADRFIAGFVEGMPGEWTSYPPHRHDEKPEAYIFFDVDPGFAVQMVMDDSDERAYVVHDYDVVLIPRGYHPNVGTSLSGIKYAWVIAAPPGKRDLSVEIHPAFRGVQLGQSHLKPRDS